MFRFSSSIRPLGCSLFLALFFIVAGSGSSGACTPKIVWIADAGIPDSIPAGTSATFGWKVKNVSTCDAVNYHLGFDGSVPATSTGNFGGENHPLFTLLAGETGVVYADMVAAPMEVGTKFKVYYDMFAPDGTHLNDLELGGIYAEFTITAPPAQPTTLISPSDNATIETETPILDWKSVSGATVYRVVLSDNVNFTGLSSDGMSCTDSSCQTAKMSSTDYQVGTALTVEFNKTYYCRHSKRPTKTPYFLDSSIYRGSSPTSITINFPDGNLVARYVSLRHSCS
ncbi:MAG: hypothetical protein V8K32_08005 [Candidatus Electrothrix gigas]